MSLAKQVRQYVLGRVEFMYEVVSNASRIAFDDLFDLYDGKYVLLDHVEEDGDGNVISGIPVVVGDEDEDEAMFDMLFQYFEEKNTAMFS